MIPFDIMKDYAAMDAVCTFIYFKSLKMQGKNPKMTVYTKIFF